MACAQGEPECQRVHGPGCSPPLVADRDLVVKQLNLFTLGNSRCASALDAWVPVGLSSGCPHGLHAWWRAFLLAAFHFSFRYPPTGAFWDHLPNKSTCTGTLLLGSACRRTKLRACDITIFKNVQQSVKIIAVAIHSKKRTGGDQEDAVHTLVLYHLWETLFTFSVPVILTCFPFLLIISG